ncbi:hypothetical protein LTR10_003249 [Elasticomyces elasticus]|nr:hypothetical protein LTR10_003249 [Elasticomyces elasticus]KAK4969520.1 hypothetical protein LTR42_008791 [Elasticomyces elasticus]
MLPQNPDRPTDRHTYHFFAFTNAFPVETKNSYHRPDPAFTYLALLFTLLSGLAWGIAYAPSFLSILRITLVFTLIHFLGISLGIATLMYFFVGRVLGRRRPGRFGGTAELGGGREGGDGGVEGLEFGYCFDVAIRAFLPLWTFLYLVQFLLLPLIARDYWVSNFFGNLLYLLALSYYFVITFLGYNGTFFPNPILVWGLMGVDGIDNG